MPLINGLHKAKLPDIRRAKGCLEWLYVGANRAMRSLSRFPSSGRRVANLDIHPFWGNFRVGGDSSGTRNSSTDRSMSLERSVELRQLRYAVAVADHLNFR
jgi:hypothetical protein